jgi:hypothetical protein
MNIYAFPLPGDPVIRPETRDEMIDRMAAESLAEIREMVKSARRALRLDCSPEFLGSIDASKIIAADLRQAAMLQNAAYSPGYLTGLLGLFNASQHTALIPLGRAST